MKLNTLFLAAAITLALAACNKPADKPADAAPAADAAAPAATPATDAAAPAATPADAAAPAATPAAASVGVAECDDYLNKVNACLSEKVPEAQRAALQAGFDQSRSAWTQAASAPGGKEAMATACKTALEQAKAQFAAYGCTL